MSIEQLKADFKENFATVKKMDAATATTADLVNHLKHTAWPFFESIIEEVDEMDAAIEELTDIANGVGDVLTFETGKVFAGIITAGLAIAGELDKVTDSLPLKQAIAEFRTLCKQGAEALDDIVLPEGDEIDEDDDDDDDDDNDDDDNDEGDAE